jgi:RimJ/RimL family protein N-acetyltransferase
LVTTLRDAGPARTGRLDYRRWSRDDAPFIRDMYGRDDVIRFLGATPSPVLSDEEARSRIERWNAASASGRGLWAIERVAAQPVERRIGTVLLLPLKRSDGRPSDVVEIGWHLHPGAWGHGYATEAAIAAVDLARATRLSEVRAVVFPDNLASVRVCQRLGMIAAGRTDEWYGVELMEFRLDL